MKRKRTSHGAAVVAAAACIGMATFAAAPTATATPLTTGTAPPAETTSPVNPNPTPDPNWGWLGLSSEKCNVLTQVFSVRTAYDQVNSDFVSLGAISTENDTDAPIPLTQDMSTTQNLTFSANGKFTGGYSKSGAQLQGSGGVGAQYSVTWAVGQTIGPYSIKPGFTGRATYGFQVMRFTGRQQWCSPVGLWTMPYKIWGIAPVAQHVVLNEFPNGEPMPAQPGTPYDKAMAGLTPIGR